MQSFNKLLFSLPVSNSKHLRLIQKFLIVLILMLCTNSFAQEKKDGILLIPEPVSLQIETGNFLLSKTTVINISSNQPEVKKVAQYFVEKTKSATGFEFKITESSILNNAIQLQLNSSPNKTIGDEGYVLESSTEKVIIKANQPAGLFYGLQTLLQLLPNEIENSTFQETLWKIPAVTISDYPRFGWRGAMLDVSRHFFAKEYVKEFIDQMVRYKLNRFHMHLTDDNGWRIEIKSLPKLTEVGAWRVERHGVWGKNELAVAGESAKDGGYYTQEDIKEIIQYAKDRYIEILPEIDVPGHSMAALAAYPEFSTTKDTTVKVNPGTNFSTWHGNGKFTMHIDNTLNPADEKVYEFLNKVFTEIAELFPFEYIHMGGDEAYHGYWEKSPKTKSFMKKMDLNNSAALQSYFVKRVNEIIKNKGKKMIGWDEILEGGLAPGAAVMSWRGTKGGIEAAKQKAKVVMSPSPMAYLDLYQGDPAIEPPTYSKARLKDSYNWDPVPEGVDANYILGGQGNLWTEHIRNKPQVEYMLYPRLFALAEVFWSPNKNKNWTAFVQKVEDHFERLDYAGVNYSKSMYDPIITVKSKEKGKIVIEMENELEGIELYYTLDNTIPNRYFPKYKAPITLHEGAELLRVISYKDGKPIGKLISISTDELIKRIKKNN
ncbi:MAG: family 20 glycosylhydrolase [Bacteroidota bacterium]|nr:family 20 glycosylhydrolase [Bacteroidota bacterium]